jgi:hypothetical protein
VEGTTRDITRFNSGICPQGMTNSRKKLSHDGRHMDPGLNTVTCLQVFESRQQQEALLISIRPGRLWGPNEGLSGSLSLEVKRPGHKDNHSLSPAPTAMTGDTSPLPYVCTEILFYFS